ncbi:carboxypeptidase regulatory-like domain-containing protein, partial [Roseisolibacter sp. H3M3-2]|uniref:carboxypeptidase regulatory-like domain-containing protein n=1 Tax=Roseisolibacter sp. H3M3-2 TaxID=3031323 RepID=UPI0023DCE004
MSSVQRALRVACAALPLRAAAAQPPAAQPPASADSLAARGAVQGVVFDSLLAVGPLAGAEVWVAGTGATARTDAVGRFRLDGLAPGSAEVAVSHPALDALGVATPARAVAVVAGRVTELRLATPSAATLYRAPCGGAPEPGVGLALGVVRVGRDGAPAAGAEVDASWGTLVLGGGATTTRVARVRARADAER